MSRSQSATVIGGGIIGAACAFFLKRAGFTIKLIEPGTIAGGTTAVGMGHVVVIDSPPGEFALTLRSRTLWAELAAHLPPQCQFRAPGTVWLARDLEEMDEAARKYARLSASGVNAELLSHSRLRELEPELAQSLLGGLLVPGDCIINAQVAAHWLLAQAGVGPQTMYREPAFSISPRHVTLASGATVQSDIIVNAAGLAARLLTSVPLRARKGHLTLTPPLPGRVSHQLVELGYIKSAHQQSGESVAFNLQPRPNGQLLVGSSRQFDVETTAVDQHLFSRMLDRAVEFMPLLASIKFERAWTGLRAATPDGMPLIGEVPGSPGVFAACGHEGLGVTTALATGELIAALATHTQPAIDPAPYALTRFIPPPLEYRT